MTRSPWQQPPSPVDADVAIVGGGIVGTSTAYALREIAPHLSVVLLEAEHLAWGASGRNAGFLLLGTHSDYASAVETYGRERARRIWAFTAEAYDLTCALDGEAFGLERTGSVLAAGTDAEAERLQRAQALLADDGVASDWVGPGGGLARFGVSEFPGALFVPTGGAVDPARLVRHLAAESRARVLEGWRVDRMAPDAGGVRLSTSQGDVHAGRVVIALNAYLPRLLPAWAEAVRPVRAQMLATAPVDPVLTAPVYSHDGYYYVRQRADGRVLVGGARHRHADAEVGYEDATTDALQADLEAYLRDHVLAAAGAPVERRWSGTMGFSPDGLPLIGTVAGVPGAVAATGFTGHGMGYGLRFGRLAARVALGLPDPALDLFHTDRLFPRERTWG